MIRIGILGQGFADWGGGIDFLRMVASSLHHAGEPVELHMLVPTRGARVTTARALRSVSRVARQLIGRPVGSLNIPEGRHLTDLADSAEQAISLREIDLGPSAIAAAARKLSLDVLIPSIKPLPVDFPTPWVGYIYDFQHRYFPELFALAERHARDAQFAAMLRSAPSVIVNARSVAEDILRFHPEARARVFPLPFSAAPQADWLLRDEPVAERYGVHGPYFIICNQFWKHKDHATAFAAFARFFKAHSNVDLVCTGPTNDYRDPEYLPSLHSALLREGISDQVHILGMVPKADQIALMKGAIALIQPTLFEGGPGGGAVYDAVSIGQRCLVSDIPVNRELFGLDVAFFPAGDVSALAALMGESVSRDLKHKNAPGELMRSGRIRRSACGAQLLAAIAHARSAERWG